MNCPICGGELEDSNNLIKICSECGLGVTKKSSLPTTAYHRDNLYLLEESLFQNIFARRVGIISKLISKPGRVLEIGCSTGTLLSLLKKSNWEVIGVEFSKLAAKEAVKKGLNVFNTKFEYFHSTEKFDLIILNHVLEHLDNPVKIIEKVLMLLADKGYVLIDVPNFGSLSAKMQKTSWPLLLPNEHLWHFNLNSLERLLKKTNFEIIFTERVSGIWDFGNPLKELFTSLTCFKLRFFSELFTAIPALIISRLNLGTDLLVIAKKK